MTDIHPFRPFGVYPSFYPYYLPRFYADYNPETFRDFYYEPLIDIEMAKVSKKQHRPNRLKSFLLLCLLVGVFIWYIRHR